MTVSPSRIPGDLNRLDRETGMLLATVDSLSAQEMAGPSRCEGWTRAHVVTHLARNADALVNLVHWARTGEETPAYASTQERDRAIAEGAQRPHDEIKRDLTAACERFGAAARDLAGTLAVEDVAIRGRAVPARGLVATRITEVILHHDDLDTVWELEEADPDAQLDALEEAIRRLEANDAAPGLELRTQEKDAWQVGGGGPVVYGSRAGVLTWLARGRADSVRSDSDLPDLPSYG